MKTIEVHLNEQSSPIVYDSNVINSYTKGGVFCVFFKKGDARMVDKYPLTNIFRIREEYK